MVDQPSAGTGATATPNDFYVNSGVNWAGFTLPELVSMVADQASVPQLERLALDWRTAGDGIVDTADYLTDALDDLMNYWTGSSAEAARHTVALNAQWVSDLGTTARDIASPIDEAAGALKSAQEAMPKLPNVAPVAQPGSAPINAEQAQALTGSPLGAAVAASSAGSRSAFAAQAEQAGAKQVAVETMQRFETAAVGIDRATPRFLGQNDTLVPRDEVGVGPGDGATWTSQVTTTTGIDMRWKLLTNLPLDATAAARAAGGIDGSNFGLISGAFSGVGGIGGAGAGAMNLGPIAGGASSLGGIGGEGADRFGGAVPTRGGVLPTTTAAGVIGGSNTPHGVGGPMGATPMGAGGMMGAATQAHRRRVPYDADDPFDTGQKASPPVIGL
jgi:PPE family protein